MSTGHFSQRAELAFRKVKKTKKKDIKFDNKSHVTVRERGDRGILL